MGKDTYGALIDRALDLGAREAKIISTGDVVFDPRGYLKCRFGCNRWGRYWTCHPHLDISPELFREALSCYRRVLVIRTPNPETGQGVALAVEKEAMLQHGCVMAFAMVMCVQCDDCAYPEPCRFPHKARPSLDCYGVDMAKTLEPYGFTVEFDPEGKLLPAWFTVVLLD